jgi:DNA repair photolyase
MDQKMPNQKQTLYIDRRVLNLKSAFQHKLLCDGPTFSAGDACRMSCSFCYVENIFARDSRVQAALTAAQTDFSHAVIRRKDPIAKLREQLLKAGKPRFPDPTDTRVIYASPLVDVAANIEMARETIQMCRVILENTHWQIRLLSKSNLLAIVAEGLAEYKQRIIYGFSTGTPDDQLAAAFEQGTAKVSKRIAALHQLQNEGYRTFGMICPSLPQANEDSYSQFSQTICGLLRLEHCEHVWCEVLNVRGRSLIRTHTALKDAGFKREADALNTVSRDTALWEQYARQTYFAHTRHIPSSKLRFLQYVTPATKNWWSNRPGAVLLGKAAINPAQ